MFFSSVVLPEPRKPVRIVTGTDGRFSWGGGVLLVLDGVAPSTSKSAGASSSLLSE